MAKGTCPNLIRISWDSDETEVCGRPIRAKGLCGRCRRRILDGKDPQAPYAQKNRRGNDAVCENMIRSPKNGNKLVRCGRPHLANGLCSRCDQRKRNGAPPMDEPNASERESKRSQCVNELMVPALDWELVRCTNFVKGHGLCRRCYARKANGIPMDRPALEDIESYGKIHRVVRNEKGHARDYICEHCGKSAAQWALDHENAQEHYMRYDEEKCLYFSVCMDDQNASASPRIYPWGRASH